MERKEVKVFLSQPMSKPTKEEVEKLRSLTVKCIFWESDEVVKLLGIDPETEPYMIKTVSTYERVAPDNAPKLYYLGEAIKDLGETDIVVFCDGWQNARGCLVERAVVETFKIPYIETELLGDKVSITHMVKW